VSLRARLLLALGAVVLLALVAADVATYSALRSFLLSRVDQGLQASHQPIEAAIDAGSTDGGFANPAPQNRSLPPFFTLAPGTFIELRSSTGAVLGQPQPGFARGVQLIPRLPTHITGFVNEAGPRPEPTVYFDTSSALARGPSFRVRASELANRDVLILAVPLSDTVATLGRLVAIELAVSGGALLLAGLVGWWLVRFGMRPLADIERTAGAIADGELGHRVPGESRKTEVGRLAGALNVMLGRIEDAFAARDATEQQLRASEGRLRRFVGDASHELRTPIAAVSAYAELFDRGAEHRPVDLARVMTGIRGETARMSSLVEDLLLLARMDEGRPIEHAPVELVALAAEALQAARTVGPAWPVSLEAREPVEVMGDAGRLRQVFDNLLSNIRAHTPPGSRATVRIGRSQLEAICEVEDDGPGLGSDHSERVFERFFRADTSRSRASGGAGLGLSIVAAIVAAHGGSVHAAGGSPGGSVFTVRLPLPGCSEAPA
jgi:two-component system OmpR family sensor kinase